MSQAISKDPKVFEKQIKGKELYFKADLVAQTSDSQSLVSISGALATTTITIDIKEEVNTAFKCAVTDRTTGDNVPLDGTAPIVAGDTVSVTLDATGASDVCIELIYN